MQYIQTVSYTHLDVYKRQQMKCGDSMCLAPLHYLTYFVPVVYLLIFHYLNRRSCDNQSIKVSVLYIIKGLVKLIQMAE